MTRDEKRQALQMWIGSTGIAEVVAEVDPGNLNEALYAISELGLWPDSVDSVSETQVLYLLATDRATAERSIPAQPEGVKTY